MLQGTSPNSSPSSAASPAASFFARINSPTAPDPPAPGAPGSHPRSFSVSAADGPANGARSGAAFGIGGVPGVGGDHLRRAVSLRSPASSTPGGMASFAAAGSEMASPSGSSPGRTAPAAARNALFSHHARPPGYGGPRPFSPASTVVSDSAIDSPIDSSAYPPSPTGSNFSSGTAASAFLSHFGRGRAMSIAGLPEPAPPPPPDGPGAKVLEYTLGKVLGRGGFSTVRLATNEANGETLACKIVKRDDLSDESGSVECFEDEIRIWQTLPDHPSLIPLLKMHRTPYATFMFMPLLTGGNLLEVVLREGGGDKTARKWFPGVVNAVEALHEGFGGFGGNMLHGDLKLDNFIADASGALRLGDFGMARIIPSTESLSVPGGPKAGLPAHLQNRLKGSPPGLPRGRQLSRSPNRRRETFTAAELTPNPSNPMPSASLPYAPPELLSAPPAARTLKQDIWAIGVILYALLTGRLPFNDTFDPRLQMKILKGQFDEPLHAGHEWLEVLHGCLERDIHARWDIRRIRQSDAVTGWREVVTPRRHPNSRSRSRVRIKPDSPGLPSEMQMSGRGRDRSRSRLRPAHAHSGSFGSSYPPHHQHHSHHPDIPSPRDETRFPRRSELESRSRSASSRRGRLSGDVHGLVSGNNDERLIAALDEVSISRGRRAYRDNDDQSRDASASSLRVPDPLSRGSHSPTGTRPNSWASSPSTPSVGQVQEHHRARSRTRLDGVQVPVPGSGPPTTREQHWQQRAHGHGHGQDPRPKSRGSPSWASGERRPPTLGFELDAVDEEERGRRGRAPPPGRGRSRSSRRMVE